MPALMMRMMDAGVRGANPWCGWTRLVLLPTMLVPVWFGSMLGGVLVMTAWMLLPVAFGKSPSLSPWMTRAHLGLQVWRSRPLDEPLCLLLVGLAGGALVPGMWAAARQDPLLLGASLAAYFAAYLFLLHRCARGLPAGS